MAVVPSNQQNGMSQQEKGASLQEQLYSKLGSASKVVDERLSRDGKAGAADLDATLLQNVSNDYTIAHNANWQPFQLKRSIQLPDKLWEQFDLARAKCMMGLFPEIERAWFTVDQKLILWDYLDRSDLQTHDKLNDNIMAVALVPPKKDYFLDEIKHVMVLATSMKVHLVCVCLKPPPADPISFYVTDIEVATNGITMSCITATSLGRIFMAGSDGHLYEVDYHQSSSWLGGFLGSSTSCTLKNHTGGGWSSSVTPWLSNAASDPIVSISIDSSRNYLYTITDKGALELYTLGANGLAPPVRQARLIDLCSAAMYLSPSNPLLESRSFNIVSIHALTKEESMKFGVLAVTSTGVRLYFQYSRNPPASFDPNYPVYFHLHLAHVRNPPSTQTQPLSRPPNTGFYNQAQINAPPTQQNNTGRINMPDGPVNSAFYASKGLFIAAHTVSEDADVLAFTAPDVGLIGSAALSNQQIRLPEVAGAIAIEGNARALAEVGARAGPGGLNDVATQVTSANRAFLIVTTRSLNIFARNRPIDTLALLLENPRENEHDLVAFWQKFGRDQACAMAIAIAAGQSVQASAAARRAAQSLPLVTNKEYGSNVQGFARQLHLDWSGRPFPSSQGLMNNSFTAPGPNACLSLDGAVVLSGRHEAFALHLSRLLRPLWKMKITQLSPVPNAPNRQIPVFSAAELSLTLKDLNALQNLAGSGSELFNVAQANEWSGRLDLDAIQTERVSLENLKSLLTQSVEAISFIILLIDHQLASVLSTCADELQQALLGLTFQDLFTSQNGREVARKLVSAIINLQIQRGQSVDAVSDTLQRQCGSFCSADDVFLHKAADNIRRAKDSPAERLECLRESQRMLTQAAGQLVPDRLTEVVSEYRTLRYPSGIIELALACANSWDAEGQGLAWWNDGSPESDPRKQNYEMRRHCYYAVITALQDCESQLNEVVNQSAQGKQSDISIEDAEALRDELLHRALATQDQPFHFHLYDWLREQRKIGQLLEIKTNFVEPYLLREPLSLDSYDLLWQYYVRTSSFSKAARVLAYLAENDNEELGLNLPRRLEYLSLAASNARSQSPTVGNRQETIDLLTEAEEKLEVAQVQMETQRAISVAHNIDDDTRDNAVAKLDTKLYNITELYLAFAEPFDLLEITLLIFHVSDHRDPARVSEIWDMLIAEADVREEGSRIEYLSGRVSNLARRFYPSDSVFPLPSIISKLEQYSFQSRIIRHGWVAQALRDGSVPYEAFFEVFDELYRTKVPPWHTNKAAAFLAAEGVSLCELWFDDAMAHRTGAMSSEVALPANELMTAADRYAAGLDPSSTDAKTRVQHLQQSLRRMF